MNNNNQVQEQAVTETQATEVKVKAYEKPFEHPAKPQASTQKDPFSYPPSSRTYQNALLQKILNMPPKTKEEMLPAASSYSEVVETTEEVKMVAEQPKRGRGRPPGAKNKPKTEIAVSATAEVVDTSATTGTRGRKPSLRKLRDKLGLNQTDMAKRLEVTQAMVSMIESGKMKASSELQNKITAIYRAN